MKARRWFSVMSWLAAVSLGAVSLVRADDHRDHDRARTALKAGEVLPLQEVLDKVQRSHPGEVLEVELEREDGRWIYELKLLQSGGRLLRLDVDAKTASVLRIRRRHAVDSKAAPASHPETKP